MRHRPRAERISGQTARFTGFSKRKTGQLRALTGSLAQKTKCLASHHKTHRDNLVKTNKLAANYLPCRKPYPTQMRSTARQFCKTGELAFSECRELSLPTH
jgi:hypothetical protein